MSSFYCDQTALLYDERNDEMIEWEPERLVEGHVDLDMARDITWQESWQRYSRIHDKKRHVIEWGGRLIAGWKPPTVDAA